MSSIKSVPDGERRSAEQQRTSAGEGSSFQIGQPYPATALWKARRDPYSLSPGEVLQLQRTAGNRAVGQLLSGTSLTNQPIIQRAAGDPALLAESSYAYIRDGEHLKYGALAGGCMAVTAVLDDGSTALGYHFLMFGTGEEWAEFEAQRNGRRVVQLRIDLDTLGPGGWYVPGQAVAGAWAPDLARYPNSFAELAGLYPAPAVVQKAAAIQGAMDADQRIRSHHWEWERSKFVAWFSGKYVMPTITYETNPGYTLRNGTLAPYR